ncbi:MAG: M20/M25/M40 family metallo-hydrolase, partial [Deferrisomatales bacterium]
GLPELARDAGGFALVTVVHARLGDPGFGTTPGEAEVHATLRAEDDRILDEVSARAVRRLEDEGKAGGLGLEVTWHDPFAATVNHPEAVAAVARAARGCGLPLQAPPSPFRWSEDFGRLTAGRRGALVGLGAGEGHPALHARDYDFPDALLAPGLRLLQALVEDLLG